MKDFIKTMLAVIAAMLVLNILSAIAFVMSMSALALISGGEKPSVPSNAVLYIDMADIQLAEQTIEDPLSALNIQSLGNQTDIRETIGILDVASALEKASGDPRIKFAYLKASGGEGVTGIAYLEEFRAALNTFRAGGKAVVSYVENPSNASIYLSSIADKVVMQPHIGSNNMFLGLSARMLFIKDLLDRYGIQVQLIRHGKYKSAGEMYIRNSISEANREQNQEMVSSLWNTVGSSIAECRGMSFEHLNSLMDNLVLDGAADFVREGLADTLMTRGQREEMLASLSGAGSFDDVHFVSLSDYIKATRPTPSFRKVPTVAIIYADGQILDGDELEDVTGDRFQGIIADVRKDTSVKAVVLRGNSPGGSVLASEKIRSELELLRAEKPVVASYCVYAASGGYWISSECDRIFSDAATLTGSIGVFSMIPNFGGTMKDFAHVGIETINSNVHSDMFSLMRPLDKSEQDYMQATIEDVYDTFTGIVARGRNMSQERVDEIAQGRVWTGTDALEINLVDEIGTLQDALRYTCRLAGNSDVSAWNIASYPTPLTPMESILAMIQENGKDEFSAGAKIGAGVGAASAFEGAASAILRIVKMEKPEVLALMPALYDIR
ncbi:MAG: signal peptide peptidase SppA [Bacteroidales bacterium]|nr:signal peptide peptidase SppA [Bacteroidales bacterium]